MLEDLCNRLRRERHALYDLNVNYKLKSAVFNFTVVLKVVKIKTLANGWKKCSVTWKWICNLKNLKSATSTDHKKTVKTSIWRWCIPILEEDKGDQGYQVMTGWQLALQATTVKENKSNKDEEQLQPPKIKLSVLRSIWMM